MGSGGDLQLCLLRKQLPIAFLGPIWSPLYLEACLHFFSSQVLVVHCPAQHTSPMTLVCNSHSRIPICPNSWRVIALASAPGLALGKRDPDLSFPLSKIFHWTQGLRSWQLFIKICKILFCIKPWEVTWRLEEHSNSPVISKKSV